MTFIISFTIMLPLLFLSPSLLVLMALCGSLKLGMISVKSLRKQEKLPNTHVINKLKMKQYPSKGLLAIARGNAKN